MIKKIIIIGLIFSAVISVLVYSNMYLCRPYSEEVDAVVFEYTAVNDVNFLSDEYFTYLESIFEEMVSERSNGYDSSRVKKIVAAVVLNKMMDDLESETEALYTHENSMRFFETFDRYILMQDDITERMHYFRNTLNEYGNAPARLEDMIALAAEDKWHLISAKYHLFYYGDLNGALNVKFVSADGRFEAVYNTGKGEKVTDPANMGTYNYAPGSFDLLKYIDHSIYDKEPWKRWGNVKGYAYEDIMKLRSGHGTNEARENKLEVEAAIEKMKKDKKD